MPRGAAAIRPRAGDPGHQRQRHPGPAGQPPPPAAVRRRRGDRRARPRRRLRRGRQRRRRLRARSPRWWREAAIAAPVRCCSPAAATRARRSPPICGRAASRVVRRVVYAAAPANALPEHRARRARLRQPDRRAVLLGGDRPTLCPPAPGRAAATRPSQPSMRWLSASPPPWHYRRSPGDASASPPSPTRTRCSRCCDE